MERAMYYSTQQGTSLEGPGGWDPGGWDFRTRNTTMRHIPELRDVGLPGYGSS